MADTARELFENMNDSELLPTVSFFQVEYAPKALSELEEVAISRGFTDGTIRQLRESCYPELNLEFKCSTCGCELVLDRDTFIDGAYTCPDCGSTNLPNYMDLELPKTEVEALSEIAVVVAGSIAGGVLLSIRDIESAVSDETVF